MDLGRLGQARLGRETISLSGNVYLTVVEVVVVVVVEEEGKAGAATQGRGRGQEPEQGPQRLA